MASTPSRGAYFIPEGDSFVPQQIAQSYWGPSLHGRTIGGFAARAADSACAEDPELVCSRLTIDLFRVAKLAPVQVRTVVIRDGRRIKVLDMTMDQDGRAVGQGRIVLLRRGEQPAGRFHAPPDWSAPRPAEMGDPTTDLSRSDTGWSPPWDIWHVRASAAGLLDGMWLRDSADLVEGEPLTPLIRLALAADMVSPVTNLTDQGLGFINADYTLYIGREPRGEYIGVQVGAHLSQDGVAIGQAIAHDLTGPVGFLSTTAVANPPMP